MANTFPAYGRRWRLYATQWDSAKITKSPIAKAAAAKAVANKDRYTVLSNMFLGRHPGSNVPWWWIPPVHYREASFKFNTQLAQGDPLHKVSTHVPRGQGPYLGQNAWERAALVALEEGLRNYHIDSLEMGIYCWEGYNGWGYYYHDVPSAYVWAGTDVYKGGFYKDCGDWSR